MILDTSIIIDILRGDYDSKKLEDLDEEVLKTTSITVMELWEGVKKADSSSEEEDAVEQMLEELIQLGFEPEDGKTAADINQKLEEKGVKIDLEEVMISAIASNSGEKVLTLNEKHFKEVEEIEVAEESRKN